MKTEKDLKEGEVICNKCSGTGEIHGRRRIDASLTCSKCWGVGKLDWIDNVMGRSNFDQFPHGELDDAVDLYYQGNKLIEMTSDGIKIC